jgi:hypothetical protein
VLLDVLSQKVQDIAFSLPGLQQSVVEFANAVGLPLFGSLVFLQKNPGDLRQPTLHDCSRLTRQRLAVVGAGATRGNKMNWRLWSSCLSHRQQLTLPGGALGHRWRQLVRSWQAG